MNYRKQPVDELVPQIKAQDFRVFVAYTGEYGFYTDVEGSRVISFCGDFGSTKFYGNYITNQPSQTGTGWGIGENREDFDVIFKALPPSWAVGSSEWRFTTLKEHLDTYQKSSKYTEVL